MRVPKAEGGRGDVRLASANQAARTSRSPSQTRDAGAAQVLLGPHEAQEVSLKPGRRSLPRHTVDPIRFERVGLSVDPFRAAPPLPAAHVDLPVDPVLDGRWRDALQGRRVSPLAIVGPPGSGRSHRLAILAARAQAAGAMHAHQALGAARSDGLVARLASTVLAGCRLGRLDHALASPRWYRNLLPLTRRTRPGSDPAGDGLDLARALDAEAPAVLLLDDLHDLPFNRAADGYLDTVQALRSRIGPGVLLAWTCPSDRMEAVLMRCPWLVDYRRDILELSPLSADDAVGLVTARLRLARVADLDIDPLHPFTPAAVKRLNEAAQGNAKRLLRMASLVLEDALRTGAAADVAVELVVSVPVEAVAPPGPVPLARPARPLL